MFLSFKYLGLESEIKKINECVIWQKNILNYMFKGTCVMWKLILLILWLCSWRSDASVIYHSFNVFDVLHVIDFIFSKRPDSWWRFLWPDRCSFLIIIFSVLGFIACPNCMLEWIKSNSYANRSQPKSMIMIALHQKQYFDSFIPNWFIYQ